MGKTNWARVLLGGVVAGVVLIVLGFISNNLYLKDLWDPAVEALNPVFEDTLGFQLFWVVFALVTGTLAVWIYSAVRPRLGAGPKTAILVGLAVWILCPLSYSAISASFGLFPAEILVPDSLTNLVVYVAATLAGAWVYKEQG